MGKIFYIVGPSGSGKDTIYNEIRKIFGGKLKPLTMYTTRPKRKDETDGEPYKFISADELEGLSDIIEQRSYQTTKGEWIYATTSDGISDKKNYIGIGTLESLKKIREFFIVSNYNIIVVPFYINTSRSQRIHRLVDREDKGSEDYDEMCRRWLQDAKDFKRSELDQIFVINNNDNDLTNALFNIMKVIISGI